MDFIRETDPKRIPKGSQKDEKKGRNMRDAIRETDPKRMQNHPKQIKIDGFYSGNRSKKEQKSSKLIENRWIIFEKPIPKGSKTHAK